MKLCSKNVVSSESPTCVWIKEITRDYVLAWSYNHYLFSTRKPPHSLSETELTNARSELIDLTKAGFKLDWLKTKLDVRKKTNDVGSRVQELEEQVKNLNLELDTEKVNTATCTAKVLSLKQKMSDLTAELNEKEAKLLLLQTASRILFTFGKGECDEKID
ncbi:unnamed protein product [Thlaspi arvense]|uniref:MATH domain-containing protein n=1 Tax=Thlaspi arvense TaxID=13288 RepID=A0AAU9RQ42_THLAR|nr:unnamed protein product [Thlaspi arvense]